MEDKEFRAALMQLACQVATLDLPATPLPFYQAEAGTGDLSVMIMVTTRKVSPPRPAGREMLAAPTADRRLGWNPPPDWPLTDKDLNIVAVVRVEPGLLAKEIAKRLGVSPRNSDLRARLSNLSARHVLVSSANRGYCLGPKAPTVDEMSEEDGAPRPDELQRRPASLQENAAATDVSATIV